MTWRSQRNRRRGTVLIPALVCLVLATTLCGVLLRQAVLRRQAGRDQERRLQTEWLVESGLARVSARLGADRNFSGEIWEIPATSLGGAASGRVRIEIKPDAGRTAARLFRVEATCVDPRGDDHGTRQTRTLTLDLKPGTTGGPK